MPLPTPARCAFAVLLVATGIAAAAPSTSVYLEDLTWTELRDRIAAGSITVLLPIGGTEQSGPHMALGKHNQRVRVLAGRIAEKLGHAVVAPVVAYVPEGNVNPPSEHMRYAGTISIPEAAFKGVLQGAGVSFRQHGFLDVVYLGDSGNYPGPLREVAATLNRAWAGSSARAHFVSEYYQAAQAPYRQALRERGLSEAQMGMHAGAADTALLMALNPAGVRPALMARDAREAAAQGVSGEPRLATAELGQLGVELIVTRSVAAIRKATERR